MTVALDRHERGKPHAAELRHPADVVPSEIHQHQVLGTLLRVGGQLGRECRVLLRRGAARAGPGDRPEGDLTILDPDQDLG